VEGLLPAARWRAGSARGVAIRMAERVVVRGVMVAVAVLVAPAPGPGTVGRGGGAGMRSGERAAAGNARSCAIPPQGHV
jgi:hypothetical protein